jgi:uncharacterized membrane protein YoaT (DUF817 family)
MRRFLALVIYAHFFSHTDDRSAVPVAKLGSWFLLLLISYALVAIINRPQDIDEHAASDES